MHINFNNLNDKKEEEEKKKSLTLCSSPNRTTFPAWASHDSLFSCISEEDEGMRKVIHQKKYKYYLKNKQNCTVPTAVTLQNKLAWGHLQLFTQFIK